MIVTYDKVQFDAAVTHVMTHNHLLGVRTWAEGAAFLTKLIKSGAKSTSSYISSGGYTVIFGCEDAMTCAEITVDATFKGCNYVQLEV